VSGNINIDSLQRNFVLKSVVILIIFQLVWQRWRADICGVS